jgi:hypothetical protein
LALKIQKFLKLGFNLLISSDLGIASYRFLRKISNAQLSFSVNLIEMRLPWRPGGNERVV